MRRGTVSATGPREVCRALLAVPLLTLVAACAPPGDGDEATVYRDTWGVPHIYAESAEAGLYASGWAMAEDRLSQLLENYLFGLGEYAAAFGPGNNDAWVRSDLESRMWDHYGTAKRHYEAKLNPELRRHLAAFIAGINDYLDAHPDEVPDWWGDRPVDVFMPVAFSRQFIWSWPAGQARSDLRAVGIEPSFDVDLRASNQIALAPEQTTFGAAALVIDPHLSWLGRHRYWELRLHAGVIHISGFATSGFPYVNLGHNEHVAWAHTTGGPDTADVYELTLDPDDPSRYLYDGEWRQMTSRTVDVAVAGEAQAREATFWYSHHGPIVARRGDRAYAAALAYEEEIGYLESKYWFMVAEDYEGAAAALDVRQIMPQNVMIADTGGNIYYQRTGRVPIRPEGYDWSRPVDGSTSETEWLGIHPASELMSLLNPERGYMQNNNIGPDTMLVGSPLVPERYPAYLYNQPALYTHQRGAVAVSLLEAKREAGGKWSEEEIVELALDRSVYQFERWVEELTRAQAAVPAPRTPQHAVVMNAILKWNGVSEPDSRGALAYFRWREALRGLAGDERMREMTSRVNDYLELFREAPEPPGLRDDDLPLLVDAVDIAAEAMQAGPGGIGMRAAFGDVFRVGRQDSADEVSWPVGGGSLGDAGMATMRAVGFSPPRADGRRWGNRGQTSTEVVILSNPIRSYTQPPIGQSDRPDSPHYRDQAEKLFSPAAMKPSWFARDELLADGGKNVVSEMRLVYRPE
jgi:acyl-homoserine lactone acylase PvdQ